MHPSAQGSSRDALSICASPGIGIAKGLLQPKDLEKNLDIWAAVYRLRALRTKILLEKKGTGDRSRLSAPMLLSSGAELQEFGNSMLEFSLQVIINIYLLRRDARMYFN